MVEERYTPNDYLKAYGASREIALNRAKNSSLNKALEVFNNLNPAGSSQGTVASTDKGVFFEQRELITYTVLAIGIGALGSFFGQLLWSWYRDRNK